MLHAVPLVGSWTASEALLAASAVFYLAMDLPLGVATVAAAMALDLAARAVNSPGWGLAAFVVGWIFQAIGHARYEKNSPAFFRNLVHLLVGPAYMVNEALHMRRPLGAGGGINRTS